MSYLNFWIDPRTGKRDRTNGHSRNCLSFQNGILDIDWLLAGRDDALVPHTPAWFSTIWVDYPFDPEADCPRWKQTLTENLQGDQERIAVLQEWMGYCLTPCTDHQKFLILEGEGANGKSVYCAGLEAVLGKRNVSHVPLEIFGQRFALTTTIGMLANIAGDCGDIDKVAEGHLKAFTSGNRMQFDRKNLPPIEATPTARLVLATNNRPRFSDKTDGIWRRIILIPFLCKVPEDKRIMGMDKPEWWLASGECPGILNWAIAGLVRLRAQERFTRADVSQRAVEDYRIESNPAREFLDDFCRWVPESATPTMEIYDAYKRWSHKTGRGTLGERQFSKELKRKFPNTERYRSGSSDRKWHYRGVVVEMDSDF